MANERKQALTVFLMVAATLFSKLLGLLRGVFMAAKYGTRMESEAFAAASKIPLTFFDLLLGAAILGCFIPVYNSFEKGREREADRFASSFLNTVILLTGLISLFGMLFSGPLLSVVTPKLAPQTAALASRLLTILFPMITFAGAAYVLVGVLQSKSSFLAPSLISAVSNAIIILYFIFFNDTYHITGLAFAYLAAWLTQFLVLLIPLARKRFRYSPALSIAMPEMKKSFRLALPIMAGSWLSPAAVLIGAFFAPFTAVSGAIAVFDFANTLFVIIAGVLAYGLCNFIFPELSRLAAAGKEQEYSSAVRGGLSAMLCVVVPVAAGVAALSPHIVRAVYQRGGFTSGSAHATAAALLGFAPGIIGYGLIELLNRVFYSRGRTSPPVIASLIGIAVNVALCCIAAFLFRGDGIPSVAYLSLSNSMGFLFAAAFLAVRCAKEIKQTWNKAFVRNAAKILLSGGGCLGAMLFVLHVWPAARAESGLLFTLFSAAIVLITGVFVFLALCFLLHIEQREFLIKIFSFRGKKEDGENENQA